MVVHTSVFLIILIGDVPGLVWYQRVAHHLKSQATVLKVIFMVTGVRRERQPLAHQVFCVQCVLAGPPRQPVRGTFGQENIPDARVLQHLLQEGVLLFFDSGGEGS